MLSFLTSHCAISNRNIIGLFQSHKAMLKLLAGLGTILVLVDPIRIGRMLCYLFNTKKDYFISISIFLGGIYFSWGGYFLKHFIDPFKEPALGFIDLLHFFWILFHLFLL